MTSLRTHPGESSATLQPYPRARGWAYQPNPDPLPSELTGGRTRPNALPTVLPRCRSRPGPESSDTVASSSYPSFVPALDHSGVN